MRIRALIIGSLAVFTLLALPAVAGATTVGSSARATTATEAKPSEFTDCMIKAAALPKSQQDPAAQKCYAAPNLLAAPAGEIFWGGLAWLIVILGLTKFAFPVIKKTLKARQDKIAGDLEAADQAKQSATTELEQYRAQLAAARNEGNEIIEQARQQADVVRADLIAKAEADAAELRAKATEDVQAATARASADLQSRVSNLSIELAEKIVERNLDHDTQIALIENYINSVGSR
jgi:F-type H+-transporting ATPase subunit b